MRTVRSFVLLALLALPACQSQVPGPDPQAPHERYDEARATLVLDQAERHLEIGELELARREIAALELEPRVWRADLILARALIAEGRYREAEEKLLMCRSRAPEEAQVDQVFGVLNEARGRWEAARLDYQAAAEKDPDDLELVLMQARTYHAEGRPARAGALLVRELGHRPDSSELRLALGEAYLASGETAEAARALRQAHDRAGGSHEVAERLVFTLALNGEHDEALARAENLDRAAISPHVALAVGRSALVSGRPMLASEFLADYVEAFRGDASAWLDLARSQFLIGRSSAALDALREALNLEPGNAGAMVLLGHVRNHAGQNTLALSTYLEALRLGADPSGLAPLMDALVAEQAASAAAAASPGSGTETDGG